MLELANDNERRTALIIVEFSEIKVGEKFTTDRWMWEKVDDQNAKAIDGLVGRTDDMAGAVFYFQPWSKVRLIAQA